MYEETLDKENTCQSGEIRKEVGTESYPVAVESVRRHQDHLCTV